jgi:predicted phage terminase large subunit-like protein
MLKRHWWRYWQPRGAGLPPVMVRHPDGTLEPVAPVELPDDLERQIQSWDLAFKGLSTSDYVVGQVWGARKADRFLLDQVRRKLDFPGTVAAVRAMTDKWPNASEKIVEDKANGPAIIATLQHEIDGLIAVNPEGGKLARASAVSAQIESGNVYLPHPSLASWVNDFLHEAEMFPNGRNDDAVDAMTQGLLRLKAIREPWMLVLGRPDEDDDGWPRRPRVRGGLANSLGIGW